jgi:hypothetical protein
MFLINIALITLFLLLLGFVLVDIILPKHHLLEKAALGYLVGIGFFTLIMSIANLFGVPFTLFYMFSLLSILSLTLFSFYLFYLGKNGIKDKLVSLKIKNLLTNLSFAEKLMSLVIVFLILSSLIAGLYFPVRDWDALALYDQRAKMFVATGYQAEGLSTPYRISHPPMTSMAHTLSSLTNITNPMYLYAIIFISFVVVFYFICRRFISRAYSLLATLALASTPIIYGHSQMAYTNLPYAVYSSLGLVYLYLWFVKKGKNVRYLVISSVLVGLGTWIRSADLLWIIAMLVVVVAAIAFRKFKSVLVYSLIFFPIYYYWIYLRAQFINTPVVGGLPDRTPELIKTLISDISFERAADIGQIVFASMISPYLPLFIAGLLIFVSRLVKKKLQFNGELLLIMVVLGVFINYAGLYVFSINYSSYAVLRDSLHRMSMFVIPLLLFYIGIYFENELNLKKNEKEKTV